MSSLPQKTGFLVLKANNLFDKEIDIECADVLPSGLPIWSLRRMLTSWNQGLSGQAKENFLNMRIRDLLDNPVNYLNSPFVTELSSDKNLEIASTTLVLGTKM